MHADDLGLGEVDTGKKAGSLRGVSVRRAVETVLPHPILRVILVWEAVEVGLGFKSRVVGRVEYGDVRHIRQQRSGRLYSI